MHAPSSTSDLLSPLIRSSSAPLPAEDSILAVAPKSNLSTSSLDEAISHIVVRPDDLASFIDFTDLEPSSNHDPARCEGTSLASSKCEEEEETAAALPLLVAATINPAITWFQSCSSVRNSTHTKQACVSCRQKKQKCEEGRPCHRCINAHRKCIDEDISGRRWRGER